MVGSFFPPQLFCLYSQPPLSSCQCVVTLLISSLIFSPLNVAARNTQLTEMQLLPSSPHPFFQFYFIDQRKVRAAQLVTHILTDEPGLTKKNCAFLAAWDK